jgi:hypothetical protein
MKPVKPAGSGSNRPVFKTLLVPPLPNHDEFNFFLINNKEYFLGVQTFRDSSHFIHFTRMPNEDAFNH